ncbi:MAG: hypothetical protein ACFFDD_10885 [Promethearchaeota archaeon]
MRRNVKIGLVVFAAAIIFIVAASNVIAYPYREDDCSPCHGTSSGLSITTNSSIEVSPGETFELDVVATGFAPPTQDVFVLRIPEDVDDNNQFTVVVPSNTEDPGRVDDNDANDIDSDEGEIQTTYSITAPGFADTYTLTIYAAQHTDVGTSFSVTVNVVQTGAGPSIGAPSTTPVVPRANEPFTVNVTVTSSDTITYVRLQYSLDNGSTWINVTMSETAGVYEGIIPGQQNNQEVLWRIVAADSTGESVSQIQSYIVGQIPVEPIELPQFHYGWLLGAPALVIAYVATALVYYDEERFTKAHGIMLTIAYFLTLINVLSLFMEPTSAWTAMNPAYLIDTSNMLFFMHAWHIWLGIISMIFGTLALLTHLGGWKTCNLGLPAVVLWTILGIMGIYLGETFVM